MSKCSCVIKKKIRNGLPNDVYALATRSYERKLTCWPNFVELVEVKNKRRLEKKMNI